FVFDGAAERQHDARDVRLERRDAELTHATAVEVAQIDPRRLRYAPEVDDEAAVRHHEMLRRDGAVYENDDLSAISDRCNAEPGDTGLRVEQGQQKRDERGHRIRLLPLVASVAELAVGVFRNR